MSCSCPASTFALLKPQVRTWSAEWRWRDSKLCQAVAHYSTSTGTEGATSEGEGTPRYSVVFVGTRRHALSSQSSCPVGVPIDVNVQRLQVEGSIGGVAWYPITSGPSIVPEDYRQPDRGKCRRCPQHEVLQLPRQEEG